MGGSDGPRDADVGGSDGSRHTRGVTSGRGGVEPSCGRREEERDTGRQRRGVVPATRPVMLGTIMPTLADMLALVLSATRAIDASLS
jgi:hypothetical protein